MKRLRQEQGQGLVELVAAMLVISIALLALMASYDEAFMSTHSSARTNAAAQLAETQLELYSSLYAANASSPLAQIGFASSLVTTAKADSTYAADEAALSPSSTTEVTNPSCSTTAAQCMPLQTSVLGTDGKYYRLETFIRDIPQTLAGGGTTTEREVTVIARDPNSSGSPQVYTVTAAFDQGPR